MGKTPSEQTDHELVGACLDGDEAAWAALVDRYAALVYSIPNRHGLGDNLSQDVFQGVWMLAVRHLGALRDAQSLAAWLITTTQRETWRVSKQVSNESKLDTAEMSEITWSDPDEATLLEQRQQLRGSFRRLDERCRDLLMEVFREERPSYDQLAERLGMPRGSIGPTRTRCLEKLRSLIAGSGRDQTPRKKPTA